MSEPNKNQQISYKRATESPTFPHPAPLGQGTQKKATRLLLPTPGSQPSWGQAKDHNLVILLFFQGQFAGLFKHVSNVSHQLLGFPASLPVNQCGDLAKQILWKLDKIGTFMNIKIRNHISSKTLGSKIWEAIFPIRICGRKMGNNILKHTDGNPIKFLYFWWSPSHPIPWADIYSITQYPINTDSPADWARALKSFAFLTWLQALHFTSKSSHSAFCIQSHWTQIGLSTHQH